MSDKELRFTHQCCVCGETHNFDDETPTEKGARFICAQCFVKVQEEYERTHPGMKLGTTKDE